MPRNTQGGSRYWLDSAEVTRRLDLLNAHHQAGLGRDGSSHAFDFDQPETFGAVPVGVSGPTVYLGDSGELVVQGNLVDEDTFGELENVLPAEGAVRIPAEVMLGAIERFRESGQAVIES